MFGRHSQQPRVGVHRLLIGHAAPLERAWPVVHPLGHLDAQALRASPELPPRLRLVILDAFGHPDQLLRLHQVERHVAAAEIVPLRYLAVQHLAQDRRLHDPRRRAGAVRLPHPRWQSASETPPASAPQRPSACRPQAPDQPPPQTPRSATDRAGHRPTPNPTAQHQIRPAAQRRLPRRPHRSEAAETRRAHAAPDRDAPAGSAHALRAAARRPSRTPTCSPQTVQVGTCAAFPTSRRLAPAELGRAALQEGANPLLAILRLAAHAQTPGLAFDLHLEGRS